MNLKHCNTSQNYDPDVMSHPKRSPEIMEKTIGQLWSVIDDTITATSTCTYHQEGKNWVLPYKDTTENEVMSLKISRSLLLILSDQTIWACELVIVDDLEMDLEERGPKLPLAEVLF